MAQIRRFIAFLQEYSIPLILGVIAGLVWANIDFGSYYKVVEFDFWNFGKGPFLDDGEHHDLNDFYIFGKHVTVHFLINEECSWSSSSASPPRRLPSRCCPAVR